MATIDDMNKVITYIENNLKNPIDNKQLASISMSSVFHFSRVFSYMVGMPVSQYIKTRRMNAAAYDLQASQSKIIDVALTYGYESPTAFNRAFKSVFGLVPSKARRRGVELNGFAPIKMVETDVKDRLDFNIMTLDSFKVIGIKKHFEINTEGNFKDVPKFWRQTGLRGQIPKIASLNNISPIGVLGLSTCMDGLEFDYYIASASSHITPDKFCDYQVEGRTWAIFNCIGPLPDSIQHLQKRIVLEWLPNSGYEYDDAPDIELYTKGNQKSKSYKCQVWIPIKKK